MNIIRKFSGIFSRVIQSVKRRFKKGWIRIDWQLMRFASSSGILSSFYYAFFNRAFDREHRSVLIGRINWEASKKATGNTTSLLRRNIHRLEKGILSQPRREIFGLSFISETYDFYRSVVEHPDTCTVVTEDEIHWAHDVLNKYFSITSSHPKIDNLREQFEHLPLPKFKSNGKPHYPYKRDLSQIPSVEYEDLLELAKRRRSVRWFLQKPVPRELIRKAVDVATLSPSACNRQPFEFRVYDEPGLLEKVSSLPPGTKGFHQNFPAIIVILGELRNYYDERDRHLIYIDASLAAMSFVYAAETQGLSTCCINWADIPDFEQRAAKVLNLEPDQRPIMFMAVGYPDPEGLVAFSQKKPNQQICRFNVT